ncbi:MAG: molybdopterin-dependent oxidoreductase [Anaerolineae bacterium]|nr:molybdopterin-dependent oxidoreductase [Anaerolineae bacterium]
MNRLIFLMVMILLAAGCAVPAAAPPAPTATPAPATPQPPACPLTEVVVPTLPALTPGYTDLDPSTGLHVTGGAPQVDLISYRLTISGKVQHPYQLAYDELRCMPKVSASPPLVCPGFFTDVAQWSGAPLAPILQRAGIAADAQRITLISADGYQASVPLNQALAAENFLAYEWEGEPLPILHGFPLRAVFPALDGNKWVKWLVEIRVE